MEQKPDFSLNILYHALHEVSIGSGNFRGCHRKAE